MTTLTKNRLNREINNSANELMTSLAQSMASFGFAFNVKASTNHVSDRILDRSHNNVTALKLYKEMIASLGNHHIGNLLSRIAKGDQTGALQNLVIYRRMDDHSVTAIPITIRVWGVERAAPSVLVTIRTFIPNYNVIGMIRDGINLNYEPPRPDFELGDCGRRKLSRLTRLILSTDCPDALKVLRIR